MGSPIVDNFPELHRIIDFKSAIPGNSEALNGVFESLKMFISGGLINSVESIDKDACVAAFKIPEELVETNTKVKELCALRKVVDDALIELTSNIDDALVEQEEPQILAAQNFLDVLAKVIKECLKANSEIFISGHEQIKKKPELRFNQRSLIEQNRLVTTSSLEIPFSVSGQIGKDYASKLSSSMESLKKPNRSSITQKWDSLETSISARSARSLRDAISKFSKSDKRKSHVVQLLNTVQKINFDMIRVDKSQLETNNKVISSVRNLLVTLKQNADLWHQDYGSQFSSSV